jgi:hypothetical protein
LALIFFDVWRNIVGLNRRQLSQIYRPIGPKQVQVGISPSGGAAASLGGSVQLTQTFDLSLPLRGLRFTIKGRLVVGVAAFTTPYPEGFLAIISNILFQGTNARQKGNVNLYNIDSATLWMIQHHFDFRAAQYDISTGGGAITEQAVPDTPIPAAYNPTNATGTFDFRIIVDLPFYPFEAPPGVRPQFLVRNEEWKDSLQLTLTFATQAGGGATGFLGVSAGGTTVVWSGYGSGAGLPTIDVYSLPMIMGLDLKDHVVPGFLTRVQVPINTPLQSAGAQVVLLNLQKQPTTRVFAKFGTSVVPNGNPSFATLSDVNATALGLLLGGNRNVRNLVDIFAHKQELVEIYPHGPIQGYNCFDFIGGGNPDSSYPGDQIGDGTTFQLTANVVGVANGYGIIVQEQALYVAEGALYSF